jgi:hypothetical protein
MNTKLCLTSAALLAAIMGCGGPQSSEPEPATTSPSAAAGAPPTTTNPGPTPPANGAEPPAETAASAAAAAPECKDLEKAAPNTCEPEASGNPPAQ